MKTLAGHPTFSQATQAFLRADEMCEGQMKVSVAGQGFHPRE
jgi:hypothetical protein